MCFFPHSGRRMCFFQVQSQSWRENRHHWSDGRYQSSEMAHRRWQCRNVSEFPRVDHWQLFTNTQTNQTPRASSTLEVGSEKSWQYLMGHTSTGREPHNFFDYQLWPAPIQSLSYHWYPQSSVLSTLFAQVVPRPAATRTMPRCLVSLPKAETWRNKSDELSDTSRQGLNWLTPHGALWRQRQHMTALSSSDFCLGISPSSFFGQELHVWKIFANQARHQICHCFPQPPVASLTPLHFHLAHVPNWFRHLSNFKRFHLEATANPHLKIS